MTDPMRQPDDTPSPCGAKTRSGRPCPNPPMRGGTRCRQHGGASPNALAKAKERVLEATVAGQLEKRGWEPITDPLAAYADLAGETWAWKELCREKLAELRSWEHTDLREAMDARPLVVVYERALDRASKQLHDMLRLGLDHQALRQAKERPTRELAEGFNRILDHVLAGLDLTDTQRAQIPELLAEAVKKEQTS